MNAPFAFLNVAVAPALSVGGQTIPRSMGELEREFPTSVVPLNGPHSPPPPFAI